jgi:hypothetical protein
MTLLALPLALLAWLAFAGTAPPARSVVLTDATWVCRGAVDLDLVQVTITPASQKKDAVLLRGCRGRIARIAISNAQCDGVKGSASDLAVGGGTIDLTRRDARRACHKDAIQITGGSRVTFTNVRVRGGGHSGFFVNDASGSGVHDVTFVGGYVGPYPGYDELFDTDVTIGDSDRSGIAGSTLCPVKQTRLAPNGIYIPTTPSTGGQPARDPIDEKNTYLASC